MRINQLKMAFELQGFARTYLDSYSTCVLFNTAQERLELLGEPKEKLSAVRNLWLWYRMYGYSCGLLQNSVKSPDEYKPRYRRSLAIEREFGETFDPKEKKYLRDFLAGVALSISGIFCLAVNPPIGGAFGRPLITSGFSFMFYALSNMMLEGDEKQARIAELENLQKQAETASSNCYRNAP
jgi:hypothetical protein